MTPLQDLITGIPSLLPGMIPGLFLAWFIALIIAAIRLGVADFRGEHRSVMSEMPFFLGAGLLLTSMFILSEARATGLIERDSLAGWLIGSLAFGFSFIPGKRHTD